MTEINTEVQSEAPVQDTPVQEAPVAAQAGSRAPRGRSFQGGKGKPGSGPRGGRGGQRERVKPEFEQKTLDVRRVTRVVSGGRRFSFSVAIVIGDRKGNVGLGMGKAGDTALAIDKAYKQAMKKMITVKFSKNGSIPHELDAKYNASKITMMPNKGRGLIAGSSARVIMSLAGIQNVTTKIHSGSKNKLNNARVTMKALSKIASPFERKSKPVERTAERTMDRPRGPRTGDRSARPASTDGKPRRNFFVKRKVAEAGTTPESK